MIYLAKNNVLTKTREIKEGAFVLSRETFQQSDKRLMAKKHSLINNFSIVSLWTLFSRILGFLRDIFLALYLGSGPVAQAFLLAFTIPNMLRRIFA